MALYLIETERDALVIAMRTRGGRKTPFIPETTRVACCRECVHYSLSKGECYVDRFNPVKKPRSGFCLEGVVAHGK